MAKKDSSPAKKPAAITAANKSAAPYTPELVPNIVSKPPGAPTIIDVPQPVRSSKPITWQLIAERAYFISISGTGGDQDSNWLRAEAELKRETDGD